VANLNRFGSGCRRSGTGGTLFRAVALHAAAFFMLAVGIRSIDWRRCLVAVINVHKNNMRYWLMKSEPDETSIDDALAAKGQTVAWTGVRNYQARNFMRDQMQVGDGVLFYHSGCAEPGIAGIAEVASTCYPDPTQFDRKSPYHDPKASPENPRWLLVDVRALKKIRLISLPELRAQAELADMLVLRRGNRLSITPVATQEWRHIVEKIAKAKKAPME
jgi:predicted RNA-binding protein with PUA-like domain